MGQRVDQQRALRARDRQRHTSGMDCGRISRLRTWLVVTIDAAPTTYDVRSQGWVFAICIHTISLGQLKRLAAITGLPPGKQSKARALYYGMRVLAQHVQQKVNLVIPSVAVWEAWTASKKHRPFVDLDALHNPEQKSKVTALYVSPKVRAPDQPGAEPHLRRRQRDAGLTHALDRLCAIYQDPAHYVHCKANRSEATNTKQYKKRLVSKCTQPPTEEGHT